MNQQLQQTASCYVQQGLSTLPARRADKRPCIGSWKQYQQRRPTPAEIQAWFSNPQDGVCIITGSVSGHLEIIDFDNGGELFDAWYQLIPSDLRDRLVIEQTPSGGWHVIYRCQAPVSGNMKLAQRDTGGKIHTLIETRGEGGLFLCAPTAGYEIMQGQLTDLPILTEGQRDILLEAAWSLNEHIPEPIQHTSQSEKSSLRPGDDYNGRGNVADLLRSHGWQPVSTFGENQRWRRPDKQKGWSATLRMSDSVFYVFSSNASPFEPSKAYSPFMVYTLLEHGGDCSRAALALSKEGYGQPIVPASDEGVDLSGFNCCLQDNTEKKERICDPGPIPESYFRVPGFIDQVMNFCLETAPYPSRTFAFCGALSLQAFLAGRKIKEPGGIRPNIYLLALASTGTGKDWPRKINVNILNYINANTCLGNRFASGEGVQDVMQVNLNMLFQTDEIDTMLRCMNSSRDGRYESIMDTLLTFYTSSDSSFSVRTKAGMKECVSIRYPHLSIFGTATPRNYYQALSERMLTNGFFSRMLIVDVGERPLCEMAGDIDNIPPGILEIAEYWQEKTRPSSRHNLSWENPQVPAAPYQGDAKQMLFEFQRTSDMKHRCADANDEVTKAIWSRAAESARKLALLYACSENHEQPAITEQAAQWAITFVDHQVQRQLYMASVYAAENTFHADCLKLKEKLRNAGNELPHSILLKRMKIDRDSFRKLIDTLVEQGDVQVKDSGSSTFKGAVYVLCE